jgi:hypothetical protein
VSGPLWKAIAKGNLAIGIEMPELLEPPNPQAHTVIPVFAKASGTGARAHDSIFTVYENGIAFIDDAGAMEGYLTILFGMGGAFGVYMLIGFISGLGFDILTIIMFLAVVVCVLVVRADTVAFRYQPVLFDRAAGKVHVFVAEPLVWWKLWQLKPPSHVQSFDWSCIRGEVAEFMVLGGGSAPRKNYNLICAVVEKPGSRKVVARFGAGMSYVWNGNAMFQRWEHIRRYMREKGPALGAGDSLYKDESTFKLWPALTFLQPLLGPGSGIYWSGQAVGGLWFFTIPFGVFTLIFLPFTAVAGLLRLISHYLKYEPRWPKEILASVGPVVEVNRQG